MQDYVMEQVARQQIAERTTTRRDVPRPRRRTTLTDRLRRVNDRSEN